MHSEFQKVGFGSSLILKNGLRVREYCFDDIGLVHRADLSVLNVRIIWLQVAAKIAGRTTFCYQTARSRSGCVPKILGT